MKCNYINVYCERKNFPKREIKLICVQIFLLGKIAFIKKNANNLNLNRVFIKLKKYNKKEKN